MRWIAAFFLALPLVLGDVSTSIAGDHDRARDAVRSGQVQPLGSILRQIRPQYPGQLLDAQLQQGRGGRWVYRIKVLDNRGQVTDLRVDATNGRVINARRGGRR